MKSKLFLGWLAFALLGFSASATVVPLNSANFYDWMNLGCHVTPGGPGALPSAQSGAGGNQADCIACGGSAAGMPIWWVTEPYINLWVADEPLSYVTSFGQPMTFRWTYHERGQVQGDWNTRENASLNLDGTHTNTVRMRYTRNEPASTLCMTNATWTHNWWQEIVFWDNAVETSTNFGSQVVEEIDFPSSQVTNAYVPYTTNYEALLFRGDGGTISFGAGNGTNATTSGQIRVQVIGQTNGGPRVPYPASFGPSIFIPYPTTFSFFVTNPYSGFQVSYPDGSQEIYGLVLYHHDISTDSSATHGPPPKTPYDSTASAYLTERIDPQGRATLIGYAPYFTVLTTNGNPYATNFAGYEVKYVVDPDGRTNTYNYVTNTSTFLQSITDPYGRTAQFVTNPVCGFNAIVDAAQNTNTFAYRDNTNGWLDSFTTPYGTTSFTNFEAQEAGATNEFEQRAILVSEPEAAYQLFYYVHHLTNGLETNATSAAVPVVSGYAFDAGTNGGTTKGLNFRNSFHWDRRQTANLSTNAANLFTNFTTGITNLTLADYQKARLQHWLLDPDGITITELISSERDPSVDAAGTIAGLRNWYGYQSKPSPEVAGASAVGCVAQVLLDGTSQFVEFDYAPGGFPQDNIQSYTKTDGSLGTRTNLFQYAGTNQIDLLSLTNALNQAIQFAYNTNHQVTNIVDALGQSSVLVYDGTTHNLTNILASSGHATTFAYYGSGTNATNNMLHQIESEPEGRFVEIAAYTNGLPQVVHVSGTGLVDLWLTNSWDGLNRLTGIAFQDGTTISNVYSALDLTATKDRLNHWTYFGYDHLEHLTVITNALSNVTTFSWCGCGALSTIIDALTNTTSFSYDNQGRLTNVLNADSSSLNYLYDLNGRISSISDGLGRFTQYAYNNQGLVTNVSNTNGTLARVTLDSLDRVLTATDVNGITVSNTFDALGRVILKTWPDSNNEGFGYATNGLISYTNRDQKVTRFVRDNAGRLTATTNANLEVNGFTYDAAGRIKTLTDGLSHVTTWNYNQFGWLLSKVDAASHTVLTNGYDANGQLTNRWLPTSGNTIYAYDVLGNLTNIDYSAGMIATPAVRLLYDKLNRLTTMVDGSGTNAFTYTATSRLQSESGPWPSNTVNYAYTQGHLTDLTLLQPGLSNWVQSYVYDSTWRLQSLASPAGAFNYGYGQLSAASALVSSIALPNGAFITNHYDSLARLDNTALQTSWGHVLDGYAYTYGRADLRTGITRNFGLTTNSVTAGYDNLGQLISWTANEAGGAARLNEQLGYGYDAANNLHLRTNGALVQTFSVDTVNELTNVSRTGALTVSGVTPVPASVTVNGASAQTNGDFTFAATNNSLISGTNTFTIVATNAGIKLTNTLTVNLPISVGFNSDSNGNLTSDGTRSFVYDAENQLTNVNVAGQWKTEFIYDGFGRKRIAKDYGWSSGAWVQTNETRFVYDGPLVIQERDSNNVPLVTYTRGLDLSGSLQGAGGIDGLLSRTDTNGSSYYHADGNGNITALIDAVQNIVARYLYDAYGKLLGKWGLLADANLYRFSSKEVHPNSGLYYYGFRFYEPNLQRWMNRDPIAEAGGINLYGFVDNGPVNFVDKSGLFNLNGIIGEQLADQAERVRLRNLPFLQKLVPELMLGIGLIYEPNGPRWARNHSSPTDNAFNRWMNDAVSSNNQMYEWYHTPRVVNCVFPIGVGSPGRTLFHYTNEKGLAGILESGELNPSLKAINPKDVRYGNGQYLSDIVPGTRTPSELSYDFLKNPFQGQKYTHFIEIDTTGLNVIQGRTGVFVIPGETPLDLTGRIISSGEH